MAVVNSAAEAKKMIASERHAEAALLTRVNTAVEKRPGDQASPRFPALSPNHSLGKDGRNPPWNKSAIRTR